MKTVPIKGNMTEAIVVELGQSPLFRDLAEQTLREIMTRATMIQYDPGETIITQGEKADSFFLIASGEVIVTARDGKESVEVARIKPFDTIGELGLILNQPRTATVVAGQDAAVLRFDDKFFAEMFKKIPDFALVTCRVLAQRIHQSSRTLAPSAEAGTMKPDPSVLSFLPMDFIHRNRVLPLKIESNVLYLGFVEDPSPHVVTAARELVPGMEVRSVVIDVATFNAALQSAAGQKEWTAPAAAATAEVQKPGSQPASPRLDALLRRMVAEGASDLHLSAGHKPRWRIDGDMLEMTDAAVLGPTDVLDLVDPIMLERNRRQFKETNDTDFAYSIPNLSRFRVNLFADNRGVGSVFRQIPDKILTFSQLGLPPAIQNLCEYPKGLVLVTGPTGSGKSTTLAAMIDHLNKTRQSHVITMEDPIEFVHQSQKCLVNQREIGPHTTSFARALKAVLREDPDIVLVGEMRDLETVALALETANTGHLVFATLHTNTAISSIARVIDMFSAEQQNQVRAVLADTLRGVVAQTLCRKIGGGRIAVLEVLISDIGIASLIRDGKTHQIMSAMQTGKAKGNMLLNEELFRLVNQRVIDKDEALSKSVDKIDLAKKLGLEAAALPKA